MVFMTHPEHGANNVSESDVAEQEKNGWKVTSRAEWMGDKSPNVETESTAEPKKRGRPFKVE